MSTFRTIFRRKHTFLAVVHVESEEQTLRNTKIAQEEGVDGIFLINHSVSLSILIECYDVIVGQFPHLWIGLNCLGLGRDAVTVIPKRTAGLWADDAGVSESADSLVRLQGFVSHRQKSCWQGLYFGGVAFKYQEKVADVAKAAQLAVPFVDVITTSGAATGQAPSVAKIRRMKEAIGDHPLAIASGITPENVSEYMPHADCFMVATGISDSDIELNPGRVRAFVKALGR